MDLPKSLEGYYQETGRAGRDGEPADAWLCYGLGDLVLLKQMIEQSESGEERKRLERRKLDALLGYCESTVCRRHLLLAGFGEDYVSADGRRVCGNCDNCLDPPLRWDATIAAQKAMSCILRTGQRFGAAHVIDVLRGAETEKIRQYDHHKLSTHGIGADMDAKRWRGVIRQLVAAGLIAIDAEAYGALRLTEASRAVLRGEQKVELREVRDDSSAERKREKNARSTRATSAAVDLPAQAMPRFDALRSLRARLAREQNVPAYVIFHDATLRAIAADAPRDLPSLGRISGVGASKLERYGPQVLETLRSG